MRGGGSCSSSGGSSARTLEFHADGQAALQLGQQVRRLNVGEGSGADEQNVVCAHVAVLG
jgi:hypothetical protein